MKFVRGDVVLVDLSFSDGTGAKVRPTVVVQSNAYNAKLTAAVVAMLTSNTRVADVEPSCLLIDIGTPEGKQSGLHVSSSLNCTNLFTVSETRLLKKIGQLPATMMSQVDQCLKAALDIT